MLDWTPRPGSWTVVVMHTDGSAGLSGTVSVGATLPWLGATGWVVLVVGVLLLMAGGAVVVRGVRRSSPTGHPDA